MVRKLLTNLSWTTHIKSKRFLLRIQVQRSPESWFLIFTKESEVKEVSIYLHLIWYNASSSEETESWVQPIRNLQ